MPRRSFSKLIVAAALMPVGSTLGFGWKSTDTAKSTDIQIPIAQDNRRNLDTTSNLNELLESRLSLAKAASHPTCQIVATSALRHSCSAFGDVENGGSSTSADRVIQESLKMYGARLAVCELREADAFIPNACRAFIPTEHSTKKRAMAGHLTEDDFGAPTELFPDYDEVTVKDTERCVKALLDMEQSWTSYSNSKQNAVQICASLQGPVQDQRVAKELRDVIQNAAGLPAHLKAAPQQYSDRMEEVFQDLHERNLERQALYEQEMKDYHDRVDAWAKQFVEARQAELELLISASIGVKANLQEADGMSRAISTALEAQQAGAVDVAELLEYAKEYITQDFLQVFGQMAQDLEHQHGLITSNNASLTQLKSNLDDAVIQAEVVSGGLEEVEARLSAINDVATGLAQNVEDIEKHIGFLTTLVTFFSRFAKTILVFILSALILAGWIFALLDLLTSFSCMGKIFAASTTGTVFGVLAALLFDLPDLYAEQPTDVFRDDVTWRVHQYSLFFAAGVAATLMAVMLFPRLFRRGTSPPTKGAGEEGGKKWAV